MDNASYKDTSGSATFTDKETAAVTKYLSDTGRTFQRINANGLKAFLRLQESMTGNLSGASLKTYNNSMVRKGQKITNPTTHAKGYESWVKMHFDKQKKSRALLVNRNTRTCKKSIFAKSKNTPKTSQT